MKVSLKLMITLFVFSTPCYIISAFNTLSQANQQGQIYEALPKTVQNSGKFVSLHIPKTAEPSTVEIIYFYPISGTKQTHGGMRQIIQISPNQTVKTVHILPPANNLKDAAIMIMAMPKSRWDRQMQIVQAEAIKKPTAAQKASRNALIKKNIASPVYNLHLKYGKINPNQIITLKIPTQKTSTTSKQQAIKATTKPKAQSLVHLKSTIKQMVQEGKETRTKEDQDTLERLADMLLKFRMSLEEDLQKGEKKLENLI